MDTLPPPIPQAAQEPVQIVTERLLLRPPVLADLAAGLALISDPAVNRFVGGAAPDAETHWTKSLRDIGHWATFGYGIFSVFGRDSGRLLGKTGLSHFARGLGESFDPYPEASWMMASETHGKGIAHEAAAAVHGWFDGLPVQPLTGRTVCIIHPDNHASLKLAARLGYAAYDRGSYHGDRPVMLERLRPTP